MLDKLAHHGHGSLELLANTRERAREARATVESRALLHSVAGSMARICGDGGRRAPGPHSLRASATWLGSGADAHGLPTGPAGSSRHAGHAWRRCPTPRAHLRPRTRASPVARARPGRARRASPRRGPVTPDHAAARLAAAAAPLQSAHAARVWVRAACARAAAGRAARGGRGSRQQRVHLRHDAALRVQAGRKGAQRLPQPRVGRGACARLRGTVQYQRRRASDRLGHQLLQRARQDVAHLGGRRSADKSRPL